MQSRSAEIFAETARAFDAHALHYDAVVEPNALLQTMREALWMEVEQRVPPPARVLDLGCGTGIDAAHFAQQGYNITAIDPSREMVNQTRARVVRANVSERVRIDNIGAHELDRLDGDSLDAIYSDLGPLNCIEELAQVSHQCARLLKPNGIMIVSVMARICPWEIVYYSLQGDFKQAKRRFAREMIPVSLENQIVWTRYYSPREFFQFFRYDFRLVAYRALNLFLPPPYLLRWYERAGFLQEPLHWLDARLTSLPILRAGGDHFLMTMHKFK